MKSVRIFGPKGREGTTVTEAEWLESDELRLMLWIVEPWVTDGDISDRKLRLFACACARRIWHQLSADTRRHTVELAERFADGEATEKKLVARRRATIRRDPEPDRPEEHPLARCCLFQGWMTGDGGTYYYLMDIMKELRKPAAKLWGPGEGAAECDLLRDIVGNPFRFQRGPERRTHPFDPAWRTEHTIAITSKMYQERDFVGMPILADALEDAGCADADILAHCREGGVHARGCWVVDLVLGKEEHRSGESQEPIEENEPDE